MNSAVHSYLILAYADGDKVAMNVGFYYTANAGGRLAGTVLSGALYEWQGLEACLWTSAGLILAAGVLSRRLPTAAHLDRRAVTGFRARYGRSDTASRVPSGRR
jgi:predicted MFS family arabinose efflux permease